MSMMVQECINHFQTPESILYTKDQCQGDVLSGLHEHGEGASTARPLWGRRLTPALINVTKRW